MIWPGQAGRMANLLLLCGSPPRSKAHSSKHIARDRKEFCIISYSALAFFVHCTASVIDYELWEGSSLGMRLREVSVSEADGVCRAFDARVKRVGCHDIAFNETEIEISFFGGKANFRNTVEAAEKLLRVFEKEETSYPDDWAGSVADRTKRRAAKKLLVGHGTVDSKGCNLIAMCSRIGMLPSFKVVLTRTL